MVDEQQAACVHLFQLRTVASEGGWNPNLKQLVGGYVGIRLFPGV